MNTRQSRSKKRKLQGNTSNGNPRSASNSPNNNASRMNTRGSNSKKQTLHGNSSNGKARSSRNSSNSGRSSRSPGGAECWEDAPPLKCREIIHVFSDEKPSKGEIKKAIEIVRAAAKNEVARADVLIKKEQESLKPDTQPLPPQPTVDFVNPPRYTTAIITDDGRGLQYGSKCFEPIEENIDDDKEIVQIRNAPMLADPAEQFRTEFALHHTFENGIHGYLPNEFQVCEESLYMIIKDSLKKAKEVENPDAVYYGLHVVFPSFGSQREFSEMFPKLSRKYTKDAATDLALEPWRPEAVETIAEQIASLNPQTLAVRENHFVSSIQKPNASLDCGHHCYNQMNGRSQQQLLVNHAVSCQGEITLLVTKATPAGYASFFNSLLTGKKKITGSAFCKEVERNGKRNCEEWFKLLLSYSSSKNVNHQAGNPAQPRPLPTIVKEQIAKKVAGLVDLSHPCRHVGPCGKDASGCTCKDLCSIYCRCDQSCKLRHYGCACAGTCEIGKCPCASMGMECNKLTCAPCFHSTNRNRPVRCNNRWITMKLSTKVEVKASGIAGNGLFLLEDVEEFTFIGEYVGIRLNKKETERNGELDVHGISYVYAANDDTSIDSKHAGNALRFINSDVKRQNCEAYGFWVECKYRIGIFAIKQAKKGTELFLNYRYSKKQEEKYFTIQSRNGSSK